LTPTSRIILPVASGIVAGSDSGASHGAGAARGAVHHHAGFFLERHPPHEILCAGRRSAAPVLVWIEDAVPVQISEAPALLLDDFGRAGYDDGLSLRVGIGVLGAGQQWRHEQNQRTRDDYDLRYQHHAT